MQKRCRTCSPSLGSVLRPSGVSITPRKGKLTRCSHSVCAQPSQRPPGQPGIAKNKMPPIPPPLHVDTVTLARNGTVVPCDVPAGPWLAQSPRGAYTTARTVGGSRVFQLSHHIQRLADSVRLMMQADCDAGKPGAEEHQRAFAYLTDPQRLRPLVVASLKAAIASYVQQEELAAQQENSQRAFVVAPALASLLVGAQQPAGSAGGGAAMAAPAVAAEQVGPHELKLTVLITWGQGEADVYAHVSSLPPRPRPPVKVQVKGSPRSNALAKDSEWVRQRKALEAGKPADVHEILMSEPCGSVLEGLTSNFFVVSGGALQTAGEGVLGGTVRQVVLEVAQREGIPVELQAPRLQEATQWEGAFITSTSRLVLPVGELLALDWDPPLDWTCPHGGRGVVSRLEQLVLQEVCAKSEPLV